MSNEIKIVTVLIAVTLTCTLTEGNVSRCRRGTNQLRESYIVHFNNKGEPLSVAGFNDFVRVLNRQQASFQPKASSYAESPELQPLQATPRTVSELTTTAEPTTPHQPRPLATGTSKTPGSIVTTTASPEPTYVTIGSTVSPLKLPHEMSGMSPMAETSDSTDKPTLTLTLGHDAAATSVLPGGLSLSDVSNLVTPGENSPSKTTVSGLGFSHGTGLISKLISLQPGVQTVLNYALPPVSVHGYVPAAQTSYVNALPTIFQKPHAPSTQRDIFNYASYPSQNLAIDGNAPLQIVRQAPSLIDIGQGLGQGYGSAPQGRNYYENMQRWIYIVQDAYQGPNKATYRKTTTLHMTDTSSIPNPKLKNLRSKHIRSVCLELPLSLGGWGGIDYSGQRSIRLAKPVLGIGKLGYAVPVSSPALSKIGFGPGSW